MTAIMCTRTLQQTLVKGGQQWAGPRSSRTGPEGRLGNWAATVVMDLTPPLVVAVEERSSLTLLITLRPVKAFRLRLAEALRLALLARRVTDGAASAEAKLVGSASFTMLRNKPELRSALEFAALETACHVCDRQDAASVQDMLEESPHSTVVPLSPTDVIERLFGVTRPTGLDPVPLPTAAAVSPAGTGRPIAAAQRALHTPSRDAVVTAVSPGRYGVQMTIGVATLARLDRVRSLLRRSSRDADLATIFEHALTLLVEKMEQRAGNVARGEKPAGKE